METSEVIRKHEKSFNRVRWMVKFLLAILFATIVALQWNHIAQFFKWIWAGD